jgi:alanyl-tRNA synthetase
MKSTEVRNAFLDYFRSKGHEVVRSSSLVPQNDPTLLFTNAGMVPFKSVFLGEETRPYTRAATCQKSMRAGGKHSDLENVGHTARHHTFFEMLGNFSFGDYFKRDAIAYGWELLTGPYGLPKDRLWITVYEDDDEAEELWQEVVGVSSDRIVRMGAKDNFWQMADTGPCGPCSEIYIDQGEEAGCGEPECRLGCDCDRFLELWNLVFMQFNREADGTLTPLPKPSIDTGMGLERISAVLQGKLNNFDSDLFSGIIGSISSETGVPYGRSPETDASIRVIADHSRAAAFLLSDGLMPANEGRGYVLRRIIRRASRHARLLGTEKPLLTKVVEAVVGEMGGVYTELLDQRELAVKVLKVEEERFERTLEQGMKILDDLLSGLKTSGDALIPGAEVFKLYDTFGFPVDLVRDIAHDSGYIVDEQGFNEAMEAQREKARASWVGEDEAIASIYREVLAEAGPSEFIGYNHTETGSVIKAVIKEGKVVEEVPEGQEAEVVLDITPFYGESGGQVGDNGSITADGFSLDVLNTRRPLEGLIVHHVRVRRGSLKVWSRVTARVNSERRNSIKRNHTATHLLHKALREVLGDHVKQAGSLVAPERLRFDFTHFSSMNDEEIMAVEDLVNSKILGNIPLDVKIEDTEQAVSSGAMALFGEKYGESVRVVKIGDYSKELCGGTHCGATGEIGSFIIESEGSVASGIRRIEALTGKGALARMNERARELKDIGVMLKAPESPAEKVRQLIEELKALQKEREALRGREMKDASGGLVENARDIEGVRVVTSRTDGLDAKELRSLADKVRDRLGSGVIVLGSALEGQASLLAMVTSDLTGRLKAGEILKQVAQACGGRGGGKPDMAQGGTKELEKLDAALESVYDIVKGA